MDPPKRTSYASPPSRTLSWIRANEIPTGGIRVHSDSSHAYPEVSGYLVPTLLKYGERELARRLTRWLLCIQRADGSYPSPDGVPHIFDTGQVLRGLLAGADLVPGTLDAARRAADYVCTGMIEGGIGGFGDRYSGKIPETVHLYVLPPLDMAAEVLEEPSYRDAALNCRHYYSKHNDLLNADHLTHFLGYQLEALIDLGLSELAMPFLEKLCEEQSADGSLRGVKRQKWVCSPGLAQIALCWYRVGEWENADKALAWLESHQMASGGFSGSYGSQASYFPEVEIAWTAKFYLDAHLLRVESFFERNVSIFPTSVSEDDGRVLAIISVVRPKDRVLEVGCGKARFLQTVRDAHPGTQCTGVDISPALLAQIPEGIRALGGSLESIPLSDDGFDVVFSVEAVEHSPNLEAAVSELIRVTRPGGWVLIIDKHRTEWGRLNCPPWERWPETSQLQRLLNRGCDNVTAESVGYDGKPASDGLMFVWRGQKRSRLSGREWNKTLITLSSHREIVNRVRNNHLSEWGQVILMATSPNERVLEIGCGTGEISLHVAQAGRRVTALDLSRESLEFVQKCAEELGIDIEGVAADATKAFPFVDDQFDCVWSSGLLEHFSPEERLTMLREQARIAKKQVITIIPNAACIAYRVGKRYQEEQGTWDYGLETPMLSMKKEFEAAGIHVTSEYSVGEKHALTFLPLTHPLRSAMSAWMEGISSKELRECNQGYLLVTMGYKAKRSKEC
jgi:malonyl-CoA O-methyltransferase